MLATNDGTNFDVLDWYVNPQSQTTNSTVTSLFSNNTAYTRYYLMIPTTYNSGLLLANQFQWYMYSADGLPPVDLTDGTGSHLSSGTISGMVIANGIITEIHAAGTLPPLDISAYSNPAVVSGQSVGNGTYTVSVSSGNYLMTPFDSNNSTYYLSGGGYSAGAYSGSTSTTVGGTAVNGEWYQLQLPYAIVLQSYVIGAVDKSYSADSWVIAGSNDGSTWTLVDSKAAGSGSALTSFGNTTFTVSGTDSFVYYRLIAKSLIAQNSFALGTFFLSGGSLPAGGGGGGGGGGGTISGGGGTISGGGGGTVSGAIPMIGGTVTFAAHALPPIDISAYANPAVVIGQSVGNGTYTMSSSSGSDLMKPLDTDNSTYFISITRKSSNSYPFFSKRRF